MNLINSRSVSRNFFSLTIGQGISLLLNFFIILLAARYLGVEGFGEFSYLIAIVGILSKIIDFGLSPIVFRETSKEYGNFELLNNALFIRILLFLLILFLYNIFSFLFAANLIEIILTDILFIGIIVSSKFQNFRDLFEIPFKVNLKMHYPMVFNILDNFILIILVVAMPYFKGRLFYFIICYTLANLPGFILLIFYVYKKFNFQLRIEKSKIKWLLKESAPLFGFVIFAVIFQQTDIIFLKYIDNSYSTGIFAGAMRMTLPLNIIPAAIVSTAFPIIVGNIKNNEKQNIKLFSIIIKSLFIISFLIAIVFSFKSKTIVMLLLGKQYIKSSFPMMLLFWSQIPLFINFFILDVLTAYNKQIWNFYYAVFIVIINTLIDFIFIPKISFMAPAYGKIISGVLGLILLIYYVKRIKLTLSFNISRILFLLLIVFITIYLISFLQIIPYLILASSIIILSILLLRFFTKEEIIIIFKLFNKEKYIIKFLKFY